MSCKVIRHVLTLGRLLVSTLEELFNKLYNHVENGLVSKTGS